MLRTLLYTAAITFAAGLSSGTSAFADTHVVKAATPMMPPGARCAYFCETNYRMCYARSHGSRICYERFAICRRSC